MSIPKIIHYCWFGGKPLPSKVKKCLESWKRFCPDFEIKQWDESNCNLSDNDYVREAYENGKYAFVSDYMRFFVIYNYGGVYFDVDVELLRPIDDLLEGKGFFARQVDGDISTGLGFAAEAGNEVVKKLLDSYENIHFVKEDGGFDLTPCPERNTNDMQEFITDKTSSEGVLSNGMRVYEPEYFCPVDFLTGEKHITENTIAVHLYANTWYSGARTLFMPVKRKMIKIMGPKKYDEFTQKIAKMLHIQQKNDTGRIKYDE